MGETTKDQEGIKSSQGTKGSTSDNEPQTFTKEQVEKEISDRLATAGRTAKQLEEKAKAFEAREQALRDREEKIVQKEKEAEEKELAGAETDDDRMRIKAKYSLKAENRKLVDERAAFEKERAAHADELRVANDTKKEILIWDIAREAKVDAIYLKDVIEEFNLTTEEQFKAIAKRLKLGVEKSPLRPDSGKTKGGENWRDLSADEKLRKGTQ